MQEMQIQFLGQEDPPGDGNGPTQYSCQGNPMDRGTWHPTVHGVTKNQTRPTFYFLKLVSILSIMYIYTVQ